MKTMDTTQNIIENLNLKIKQQEIQIKILTDWIEQAKYLLDGDYDDIMERFEWLFRECPI